MTSFTPSTPTAQTRGVAGLWQRLCGPNPKLDSVYIFQPYMSWGGALAYEVADNDVVIDSKEDYYDGDYHSLIGFSLDMNSRVAHSVGANVMFGPIQLGFLREVGSVEKRNRTFAFRWIANFFALDVRYKDYFSMPGGAMTIEVLAPEDRAVKLDPIPVAATMMAESKRWLSTESMPSTGTVSPAVRRTTAGRSSAVRPAPLSSAPSTCTARR